MVASGLVLLVPAMACIWPDGAHRWTGTSVHPINALRMPGWSRLRADRRRPRQSKLAFRTRPASDAQGITPPPRTLPTRLRYFVSFVVGGLFGLFAGFAVGIFVYPYIFLTDIVGTDEVADATIREVLARGTFVHANSSDPIHYGKRDATVC